MTTSVCRRSVGIDTTRGHMLTEAAHTGIATIAAIPVTPSRRFGTLHSMYASIAAALTVLSSFSVALAAPAARVAGVTPATAALSADEFPEEWFWRIGSAGPAHKAMTGKAPPTLALRGWIGKDAELAPLRQGDLFKTLKGKVIVIDFWATWCGPCRKALPENAQMMKDLGSKGLVVIGVHDSERGSDTMEKVATAAGVEYPLAVDDAGKSAKAWKVGFWPTYAVIDRAGILRAIGLQPLYVRAVAEKLLAEPTPAAGPNLAKPLTNPSLAPTESSTATPPAVPATDSAANKSARIPREMLEGDGTRRGKLAKFDQCPVASDLSPVTAWTNTALAANGGPNAEAAVNPELSLKGLKGKVVLLDFWATWCGPCIAAVPKLNALQRKYAAEGLVVIGVCRPDGGEKMLSTVKAKGIEYAVCIDVKGEVNSAYKVDSYPDYYLIDREGRLRGADINAATLEEAVKLILAEK